MLVNVQCSHYLWQCSLTLIGFEFVKQWAKWVPQMLKFAQNKILAWTTLASCSIQLIYSNNQWQSSSDLQFSWWPHGVRVIQQTCSCVLMLRGWPCFTAAGWIGWNIALILFCLKSQFINPFEVHASKVMLWYNFTVFDPFSSGVFYNITISVPRTLSIISVEWVRLW